MFVERTVTARLDRRSMSVLGPTAKPLDVADDAMARQTLGFQMLYCRVQIKNITLQRCFRTICAPSARQRFCTAPAQLLARLLFPRLLLLVRLEIDCVAKLGAECRLERAHLGLESPEFRKSQQ